MKKPDIDKFWEIPETDVLVNYVYRHEAWHWAKKEGIAIEYQGTRFGNKDVWRIPNEVERTWFRLRWE